MCFIIFQLNMPAELLPTSRLQVWLFTFRICFPFRKQEANCEKSISGFLSLFITDHIIMFTIQCPRYYLYFWHGCKQGGHWEVKPEMIKMLYSKSHDIKGIWNQVNFVVIWQEKLIILLFYNDGETINPPSAEYHWVWEQLGGGYSHRHGHTESWSTIFECHFRYGPLASTQMAQLQFHFTESTDIIAWIVSWLSEVRAIFDFFKYPVTSLGNRFHLVCVYVIYSRTPTIFYFYGLSRIFFTDVKVAPGYLNLI